MAEAITPEPVPGASQLNAADGKGTASVVSESGMTLEELNTHLGKTFPTKEAALKSIKDTYSYVGKKSEDIKKEVFEELKVNEKTDTLAKDVAELRKEQFYDRNPQYAEPSIRKMIERIGGNPSDVVSTQEFKDIFTKVSEYDKSAKLKTVLESNPRLASSKDSLTKAREAQDRAMKESRTYSGRGKQEAESLAVDAVKQLLEL